MKLISPDHCVEDFASEKSGGLHSLSALLQFVVKQTLLLHNMGFVSITASFEKREPKICSVDGTLGVGIVEATEKAPIITHAQMQKIYNQERAIYHSMSCPFPEGCNCGVSSHNESIARTIHKVASVIAGSGRAVAHDTLEASDRSQEKHT